MTNRSYVDSLNFRHTSSRLLPQRHLNRPAINAITWRHYSFPLIHVKGSKTRFLTGKQRNIIQKSPHGTELLHFLVDLALAEQDSKNAGVFFQVSSPNGQPWFQAFLVETVETRDKNRDDFHCMQMSLVMSMWFISGDDSNDAPCSIVPVPAVKCNLQSWRDCVQYLLSPILCFIKPCYDKKEFDTDRS